MRGSKERESTGGNSTREKRTEKEDRLNTDCHALKSKMKVVTMNSGRKLGGAQLSCPGRTGRIVRERERDEISV